MAAAQDWRMLSRVDRLRGTPDKGEFSQMSLRHGRMLTLFADGWHGTSITFLEVFYLYMLS